MYNIPLIYAFNNVRTLDCPYHCRILNKLSTNLRINVLSSSINICTDVNDNAPVFTNPDVTFSIDEDEAVGFLVGTVAANDLDIGNAGINQFLQYLFIKSYSTELH